ncbi:MAG: M23 family metallopeptidase [Actinobacteria bacterium]|nr:M23 family metallopeptidase [Actinomycetota bacterium]MCI0544766.1 M23 family metallopeptidase [Actinomycetota bacterium]MCI0678325.1 M23 family metallopeptidase [Actinomycetota bacterium]
MLRRWITALVIAVVLAVPLTASAHEVSDITLTFPQDVAVTSFVDDWLDRRSGGRRHEGNDLMAPKMTEVYAAADGVVIKVSESARAGRYLILEHADGWETYYIHLNDDSPGSDDGEAPWALTLAPGLRVGSEVTAGQLIGYVGDSGNAEGGSPHTHFELHYQGLPLNPHDHLVSAWERAVAALLDVPPPVVNGFYMV